MIRRETLFVLAGVGVLLILAGCGSRSMPVTDPVEPPPTFSDSGTQDVPPRWWRAFGDTGLNTLVETGLAENLDLKTAWDRLRAARAVVDRESAVLLPTLDAFAEGTSREDESPTGSVDRDELTLGLTAEYELDLWGRIQSRVEAERFRSRATLQDLRAASISLSAEVARTWYALAEQRQQRKLLDRQIRTNRRILNLIRSRFANGQAGSADVLRQEQLLESTREQKRAVESQVGVLEHQLAVLVGRTPQEGIQRRPRAFPELPPLPETGVPVELIQRRPDVRAAFQRLRAADRDLAASISNQYPRLTLTASLSSSENDVEALFDHWARSFAANLTQPLIDGGQRAAEVDRTRAVKQQRLHEYGQSVLTALQDVEDALVQEQKQKERIRSLQDQVGLARRTTERLQHRYFNGAVDYIEVLNALNDQQQLRRDLLSARRLLIERRIALYRALAGPIGVTESIEENQSDTSQRTASGTMEAFPSRTVRLGPNERKRGA